MLLGRLNDPGVLPIRPLDDHQHSPLYAVRPQEADNDMSDPIPNDNEFEAAEKAIRNLGSNSWFGDLTPHWQDFLVSHTVETFKRYEVTMDQAAQKLIEFYVEMTVTHPEAKTLNPWEARLPAEGAILSGNM
jgi:hypothetical protein